MSQGGHDRDPTSYSLYSPALAELSDLRAWVGPSGDIRDLEPMLDMMYPLDDVLQRRPVPVDMAPETHDERIGISLRLLNLVHDSLDALLDPTPPDMPLSFADVVYCVCVIQRGKFDKALEEGRIEQIGYDEAIEDLLHAASDICTAFDLAIIKQSLPRQRTGPLILGKLTLRPHDPTPRSN